ncbi:zinc finger protein 723-like isoform X2 [Coccinella septempunctata]|uniref:zinc finger protein 723-like isoform X2 n=1 Tax=Coccinella septempunctata TaxID=41139 RepID=UPI001D083A6E|nr:zinc finger protein 723-like isoform X2 [Coccinella septempunctata]
MFDPNTITTQQSQIQYQQQQPQQTDKDKNQDGTQKETFPSFCYANVNMIHKITPNTTQPQHSTVNMSQLSDDKCYITQPFSYNYALVNQMSLTQNTITFKCEICGLMFAHLSLLNHHKRTTHQQGDQGQIQQPQQITLQVQPQQQQTTQIQIVSADRIRFSCEECGLTFATQQELKTHKIQSHSAGQQVVTTQVVTTQAQPNTLKIKNCESCGAPLPQDNNKKRAVMKVKCESCLSAEAIQPQIFVVATAPDTSTVKFEESTGTQTTSTNLEFQITGTQNTIPIGVKNNHPVKRRGFASAMKCTKCNGSGIIFIGGAKNQQNNVDKPFHCNICNGSFSRYSSLWSHKRLHTGEKNFKCNICGLAFAKAAYLKNHSRIHTGEKPYRCNVCGMQFSQSPHLKNHERIHSGERPYVCEVCEKKFARHSTLWNHRRIHTGEKPYRCDICGSCFNQATHLKNHAKVHSGEKPFKCDICAVGFSDRFALKRHRNIHEKYGRTKPQVTTSSTDEAQTLNATTDSNTSMSTTVQEAQELETQYEAKYEQEEQVELTEEMTDISELQVQLA